MDELPKGYNFSWTQPYPNWQPWNPPQLSAYNETMMDTVELRLQKMDSYPDAVAIIQKVKNGI